MSGTLIDLAPDVSIGVDYWDRKSVLCTAYFLTHLHSDHTAGLNDAWVRRPIYCSPHTLALLREQWPCVAARAHALDVDKTTRLSLLCPSGSTYSLSVTPLNAHHCVVRLQVVCTAYALPAQAHIPATCASGRAGSGDVPA